ncbi:MAG: Ig-like domain-containing protein, partial [Gemmatimonadota bacterium]
MDRKRGGIGLGKAVVGLAFALVMAAIGLLQSCTSSDVTSVVIGSVNIDPAGADLLVDDSVRFKAVVRANDGTVLSAAAVTWSSGDPSVASIDQQGMAHALKPGSANIRASFRDVSGSVAVTVAPRPAISASPDSVSFSGSVGGTTLPAEVVQVTNGGGGTLQGLLAIVHYASGQPTGWLDASLASSSAPASLVLTPTVASLPAGTFDATVVLSSPVASNSPLSIPVVLTLVEDRPIIHLNPDSVTLRAEAAGS